MPGGDGGLNAQPTGYVLFQKVAQTAFFKEYREPTYQRRYKEHPQQTPKGPPALPNET